jgi:hypothetical protein
VSSNTATETSPTTPTAKARLALSSRSIPGPSTILPDNTHASYPKIARTYTCDGANISPALHWSDVPPGTAEIAIILLSAGFRIDWALAGLNPSTHELTTGKIPHGAVVGDYRGKHAYAVCPPKGRSINYGLVVFAFPHRLSLKPGFKAATLFEAAEREATAEGVLTFSYKRR